MTCKEFKLSFFETSDGHCLFEIEIDKDPKKVITLSDLQAWNLAEEIKLKFEKFFSSQTKTP
jgi:hypothetical protein